AFVVARLILPSVTATTSVVEEGNVLAPFLEIEILPLMDVVTALLIAFIFGIGVTKLESNYLKGFFDEGKEIIERVISGIIIPFLPFYIAGIFAEMAYAGTVFKTLKLFAVVLIL